MNAPVALIDLPALAPHSGALRRRFEQPLQWLVARRHDEVADVIAAAQAHSQKGHWCVGWVAYEAAPAFDAALHVHASDQALVMMAVFDQAHEWTLAPAARGDDSDYACEPWQCAMSRVQFNQHIAQIHRWIQDGEVYQINLTSPMHSRFEGQALDYFRALHRAQPASHAVYLHAPDHTLLCLSPELFFDWREGGLVTMPMKGTAARGDNDAHDLALAQALTSSHKERAENLMIVDLLRNDLSRIAVTGSVSVPQLFELHALPTVWQMTSTVQARTAAHTQLLDVFKALFPCGSVTGAPKVQAMRRIHDLEPAPRGIYCGAVGVIEPGGASRFAVAIRTVTLKPMGPAGDTRHWAASYGVGSGITVDAQADAEWAEWRHKQRFLQRAARPFELLESLLLDHGELPLLERHLQRLARAAAHFGFSLSLNEVRSALLRLAAETPHGQFKLRLRCDAQGHVDLQAHALDTWPTPLQVALGRQPIDADSEFVRHKTTQRDVYAPFQPCPPHQDTLLWNERGQLTEFTMGNVALRIDGAWLTPPLTAGLLPGTLRAQLLDEGKIQEATLSLGDVLRAQDCAFINSVRGWLPVDLSSLRSQVQAAIPPIRPAGSS